MELFFFADERLRGALTDKLKAITDEAKSIYNGVAVTYASTMPAMGIMGSHFTDAGTVIRVGEYGTQRDAGRMIGEMHKVLGKDERLIVFITLDDLTCNFDGNGYLNFCFGLTSGSGIVISMTRFRRYPIEEQKVILSGLVMHEIGHYFNAASDGSRANTEYSLGMHCTDRHCVMQQGLTVRNLRSNFLRVHNANVRKPDVASRYYCPLCRKDIADFIARKAASIPAVLPGESATTPPLPPRQSTTTPPLPPRHDG